MTALRTAVLAVALLIGGCDATEDGPPSINASSQPASMNWGPLAVIRMDAGDMNLAQHVGALEIGQNCVTAGGLLLVWADSQTHWDQARSVIVFDDPLAEKTLELANGDEVTFAGGEFVSGEPWVNAPDDTCPSDTFQVSAITSINGSPVDD